MDGDDTQVALEDLARRLQGRWADRVTVTVYRGNRSWSVGDTNALHEVGSITKVFVGTALSALCTRGVVAADQSVRELLLGSHLGESVTLAHLAAHTSGLPRLPWNFRAHLRDRSDPYANYGEDALSQSLLRPPKVGPGRRQTYSNYGYAVLARALCERTGRSLTQLLNDEVLEPLGLDDTTLEPSESQRARLVQGHTWLGKRTPAWSMTTFAAAGGLRSTGADLVRFLRAQGDPGHPLRPVFERARQVEWRAKHHATGLAWFRTPLEEHEVIWHTGGTAGSHCYVGFVPEKDAGVVALVNRGPSPWSALVFDALEHRSRALLAKVSASQIEEPRARTARPSLRSRTRSRAHRGSRSAR